MPALPLQRTLADFVEAFGGALPSLREMRATPQDPEWHGEGDVFTHTAMVLDALRADPAYAALLPPEQAEMDLGAALHDLAKPGTTREMEILGVRRIAAPQHEAKGRSALAVALAGTDMPWSILWRVMGMVGYHQQPKRLVVKEQGSNAYKALSRKVDLRQVGLLEMADMRGRICPDRARQIDHIEMFSMFASEYAPEGWLDDWREHFSQYLAGRTPAFRARCFAEAIRLLEAGQIHEPADADFLAHRGSPTPPELMVLCGPSGSGKSTFVRDRLQSSQSWDIVSMDAIRGVLAEDRSDQSLNGAVRQAAKADLKAALRPGRRVVWDATSLRADFRSQVCQTGFDYGALVTIVVFALSPEAYAERNKAREHAVPAKVLRAQLDSWEWPEVDEAHQLIVLDQHCRVRGAYGLLDPNALPWGLRYATA